MDGQEVAGVIEPLDQLQFVLDQIAYFVWDAVRKPLRRALPGQFDKVLLWASPIRDHLLGVFIAQFVEVEPATLDDIESAFDRIFMAAKQARHFLRQFQMTLGIGGKPITGFADRAAFADTGQHVLQWAALGQVVEHIIGRDERQVSGRTESS